MPDGSNRLLEALAGSVALIAHDGTVVSANRAWHARSCPLGETLRGGASLRAAMHALAWHPEQLDAWLAQVDAVRDGTAEQAEFAIGPGATAPTHVALARRWDDEGTVLLQVLPSRSASFDEELRQRVEELDATRRRLELALEGSRDGFWDLDVRTSSLFTSPRIAEIYGRPDEGVPVELRWHREKLHPDEIEELDDRWLAALKGFSSYYFAEHRVRSADGQWVWVATRGKVVERDADGRATRFVGIMSDISERRQLEEQLAQSQKMDSIGRLAGGIAHDFNNLITGVLGYAELLRARLQADPRSVYVDEIVKAANRAGNLTAQLLEFARRRVVEPRVLDLNACVEDLEPMLGRLIGEDVELDVQLRDALWAVKLDPAQFEQILVNLAVNARDAMPEGGRLTIATGNVRLDREYVRQNPDASEGQHVVLVVTDTGLGMDDETKWRIFEPFFTTKARGKGTGLGLSTCYGIIAQAGGHIRVFSEPGSGSSFRLYFPSVEERPAYSPAPSAAHVAVSGGTETILLAEDEDVVRMVVEETLMEHGYTVLACADGRDAVQRLDDHDGTIDLVLTDLVMPHLNGRQVAEHVRSTRPETRVLLMSGYVEDVVSPEQSADADIVLAKPFATSTLLEHIRRLLDGQRGASVSTPAKPA